MVGLLFTEREIVVCVATSVAGVFVDLRPICTVRVASQDTRNVTIGVEQRTRLSTKEFGSEQSSRTKKDDVLSVPLDFLQA